MTTQHTHSEPNDVDANAVNYPHAPATDAAEVPFVPVTEAAAQANGNSAEHSPMDTPTPVEVAPADETVPASAKTEALPGQEIASTESTYTTGTTDELSVRPFTEYFEEFRQSEARSQATLPTYEVDTPAAPASEGALPESEATPGASADLVVRGDEAPAPKEAAVSPLLRPPSRLRMPRHGSGRVREVAPL
ncbi:MAG: hypothetical protein WCD86_23105, partial [Ktedonobacteraceae bacterium]